MIEFTATSSKDKEENTSRRNLRLLGYLVQAFFTIAVPILLTLMSVRVVMTPLFLQIEYNRPGFPEDIYGFTTDERLEYGQPAISYLLNGEDIDYLADQTFPNGAPLYNARELRHMEDVKVVTRAAYFLLLYTGIAALGISALAWWQKPLRRNLRQGLMNGAILTLTTIAFIVAFALFAWDFFFTTFHNVFFESGTWRFAYSDTLIRLFPEQLWFDAAIIIGGLTLGGSFVILFVIWRWGR